MNEYNAKKYIHIEKDELYEKFIIENKTRKECADYFKCSEALIKKKCKLYNIVKTNKLINENTRKTLKERYGTELLYEINVESQKETNRKRYGAERPFQSKDIQRKVSKNRKMEYSSYEKFVADNFIKMGISYEKEKEVLINDKYFYFDFCINIDGKDIYIEVDGEFHIFSRFGLDRLERNIINEQIKNEYCFSNDIKLVRIPYFITDEQKLNIIKNTVSPD